MAGRITKRVKRVSRTPLEFAKNLESEFTTTIEAEATILRRAAAIARRYNQTTAKRIMDIALQLERSP